MPRLDGVALGIHYATLYSIVPLNDSHASITALFENY